MTAIGNATPLICIAVLILALVVPPAAQQGGGNPACECPQNTVSVGVLIGACVAVLVGTLIFEALAVLCYRRYCREREKPQKVAHRFMISPQEELVVKENLAYESDSEAQERSLRAEKEQKRASIFNISETKDNLMFVPALYRNPISRDRDTGNAIMNGYQDLEPELDLDIYTYNAGWGSRVPGLLSGKAHSESLEDIYMDTNEFPILRTPFNDIGPVNFASSKYRNGFGQKNIDVYEDDGEVTTYTYSTGFGGKLRHEVATVTTGDGDNVEIEGERVTWQRSKRPEDVILAMDEGEAEPETRIAIDNNFTIGRPASTSRGEYTTAEIHGETPGTSTDPSGNFILRATPPRSRSDSSDEDLYDYGESNDRQTLNMFRHTTPGRIGHGTYRGTVGGIPLDRHPSDETPIELFNSRYRYSTGLNKAKLVAMRAAAAAHARQGIINEDLSDNPDGDQPVFGYIKLVRPDTESQSDEPTTLQLHPVGSSGKSVTVQKRDPQGFGRNSYIRHRRETYLEVADAQIQCEILRSDTPNLVHSEGTRGRTSILRNSMVSSSQHADSMDDIPTIGVIRLMQPKSSYKQVRIKEDLDEIQQDTLSFSEEDEIIATSLEDISYRSGRSQPEPETNGQYPFEEVPTIGVIRLVRPENTSDSSGVESEVTSEEESVPEGLHGQSDKWTQHEVPIIRLAQQILQESVQDRTSTRQSLHRFDQSTDEIPTIGVVRLVRPKSTVRERPTSERHFTSQETASIKSYRDTPVADMPTIGVIKLLKRDSTMSHIPQTEVLPVDTGTQPENSWGQLLQETNNTTEREVLHKSSRREHAQPRRELGVFKLKRDIVEPQMSRNMVDHSVQCEKRETRDGATNPSYSWTHLVHEVEDQIERRYRRMSAPAIATTDTNALPSVQKLGVIKLKAAPEKIVRDSFTQISGPHTYEKSTGPAWSFGEIKEEIEEEAVRKFKKTLKSLERPSEPQDFHEPLRSVSVIKLKKHPQQEKLVRDSVSQTSTPNSYEKSTGPTRSVNELQEDIEEEAIRKFKRTLSQLGQPSEATPSHPLIPRVSVIKLKKEPTAEMPVMIERGVQPDLRWRELKEEIEDDAIDEYKKRMRQFQPKEEPMEQIKKEVPRVSVIKLKGAKSRPLPEKSDNITQCEIIKAKPAMADQVTEPSRPWSDVLHNVRRILENEYRRTIHELETRLTSLPKDDDSVIPTVAVFKLKEAEEKIDLPKAVMVDEKMQAAPHMVEQDTSPERPWKHILHDLKQILENEYRHTIRELEDQLSDGDEPDTGKTVATFKPSSPEVPKVQTVSMCTQVEGPLTGEQGTIPDRSWDSIIKDVRTSVENEYRVSVKELESQLEERSKEEPKVPTRLGIFKLKAPKQAKVKKRMLHNSYTQSDTVQFANKATQPSKPWLSLINEMEEIIEEKLLKKIKPNKVEPEIVKKTNETLNVARSLELRTETVCTASQTNSMKTSSLMIEAKIQPDVAEQGTSCDISKPAVNESVQTELQVRNAHTLTDGFQSSDFFQIFKPEVSTQEIQASPSQTAKEVGVEVHPTTKDLEVLTDHLSFCHLGLQVDLEPLPQFPIITPTVLQPVNAPIIFKDLEQEKIDFAIQVMPQGNSKASSTEQVKSLDNFVQVGDPMPSQMESGVQVKPQVSDNHSSTLLKMVDAGTNDELKVPSHDQSTETVMELLNLAIQVGAEVKSCTTATDEKKYFDAYAQVLDSTQAMEMVDFGMSPPTVNYVDKNSQMYISTFNQQIQVHSQQLDASTEKDLQMSDIATAPKSTTLNDAAVQVCMEIETEPAIIKAVVQNEQFAMPLLPVSREMADSVTQTMQETAEFSNQFGPATSDKSTEKSIAESNIALQTSQYGTNSSTETIQVVKRAVPVQVRPRTADITTEYELKPRGVDVDTQHDIESRDIAVSAEIYMIEEGTTTEIKIQFQACTQTEFEITAEPVVIQEVIQTQEAVSFLQIATSEADTQTSTETKQEGTVTDAIKTANAMIQHAHAMVFVDESCQVTPSVVFNGTAAYTGENIATQAKPETAEHGMTTAVRGSSERSTANLLLQPYQKPLTKDATVEIKPESKSQGTYAERANVKAAYVQVSPAMVASGQTSKPDINDQWCMTDDLRYKDVFEITIPHTKPVEAQMFTLKAECVDKTTQVQTFYIDSPSCTEVSQVQAATQYDYKCTETASQSEPQIQSSCGTHMDKHVTDSTSQTKFVQNESVGTSAVMTRLMTTSTQYEPHRFRSSVSNQTKPSTTSTGFSSEKLDTATSSTQYEEPDTAEMNILEKIVTIEEIQTLESLPQYPDDEGNKMENSSQTEPQTLPSTIDTGSQHEIDTKNSFFQSTRVEVQSKTMSTDDPQLKETYVQYDSNLFMTTGSSQTSIPLRTTGSSTMTKSLITTGVSPDVIEVKASSFQCRVMALQDQCIQTEEEEVPFVEELVTIEEVPTVEYMSQIPAVDLIDAETQVEQVTQSDQGILTRVESKEATTATPIKRYTEAFLQNVPHLTSASQQKNSEITESHSQGTSMERIYVHSKPAQVKPSTKSFEQMMKPNVSDRGTMAAEEPETIVPQVKMQDANTKAKPPTLSTATDSHIERKDKASFIQPETKEVPSQMEVKQITAFSQTVVRQYTSSSQTIKSIKSSQTAIGFQTDAMVEVSEVEVQTNPVTIIEFVPVLVDSTVQYEPMYFYSASTQVDIPTMHKQVNVTVPSKNKETEMIHSEKNPSSSQTETLLGEDNGSQTDPLCQPEPFIIPMAVAPIQFAPSLTPPVMKAGETQTSTASTDRGISVTTSRLNSHVQVRPRASDATTETPTKIFFTKAVQGEPSVTSQILQANPEVREESTETEMNPAEKSSSQTDPLPVPEPFIVPNTLEPVHVAPPSLLPEMLVADTQTESVNTVHQGTSMKLPQLHDMNTMTSVKHYVPKAVQEQPSMQSQVLQANPEVRVGSTWTEMNPAEEQSSQTDPLPEPEPLIAPITLEPVHLAPSLLPEMLAGVPQTESTKIVHQGTSMQLPQLHDINTMTPVKHYVPKAVQEEPSMQSQVTEAYPEVRVGSTWTEINPTTETTSQTEINLAVENGSQTDPQPKLEPLIAPNTMEPVHLEVPFLLPEMLVAESQMDKAVFADKSTSMKFPKAQSTYVQAKSQMHDMNTMTPVKDHTSKAVQEQPSMQSQVLQVNPEVHVGSTWTEINRQVESTSQTDPVPEPEPFIVPITLEPVHLAPPSLLPEMLVADTQTESVNTVHQGTSMKLPQLHDMNTMTSVKHYVPKAVQEQPSMQSQVLQANPEVRVRSTWTEMNSSEEQSSQTDPLPEPEPLIAPITLEPVHLAPPSLLPEMLVADPQTESVKIVHQGTSMKLPQLHDMNTMTPVKHYVPKAVQEEPSMQSQVTEAYPEVRVGSTWTEINPTTENTSQTEINPAVENGSQTESLPEPEPLIAPNAMEPVHLEVPSLLPEMLVAESQTERSVFADKSTSMKFPKGQSTHVQAKSQMHDMNTMTPVKYYVSRAVHEQPTMQSRDLQVNPEVRVELTWTEVNHTTESTSQTEINPAVQTGSQTDPLPEPEPFIAPTVLEPVHLAPPALLPEMLVGVTQTESVKIVHQGTSMKLPQLHDMNTMTPVKHYVPKAVQEQPSMQSQVLQANPEVCIGSTWTEMNPAEEQSSQTDPLPEPEPLIAPITLKPVHLAPSSLLPEMLVGVAQTESTKIVHQGTSMHVPQLHDINTMTPIKHYVPKAVQEEPSMQSQVTEAYPEVRVGSTWTEINPTTENTSQTEINPAVENGSQTESLPEPEPLIAPNAMEPVHLEVPSLLPEMLVAESQTERSVFADKSTSMKFPKGQSTHVQAKSQMHDMNTNPAVQTGSQTDPLPEPEPFIAPTVLEPVHLAPPALLPEMLVGVTQTECANIVHQGTSMQLPQLHDINTMTPVRQYVPKAVQEQPSVQSRVLQANPEVRSTRIEVSLTTETTTSQTELKSAVQNGSQTDPLLEPESLIPPITLEPVHLEAPSLLPEMLVAESQTDEADFADKSTSMKFLMGQSTYVQAKSQMHELSTMTPVKHYVHKAVQEQPTVQSQVLQVNPEVRVGSTLTEINPAEESSSQTMQVPKLYSNHTQVTLQMRNTSTMTSPMHTVAKAVQEQPSLNSMLIQAHPDVGDGTTWIETYPHIEHGSQTDPLPEVEPLIAPATIEQVYFPPTLIPEMLVAESQTETIHQVDHETSMQSAFFFSSYTQVSPKMTDTYTMTHPRRNAPKAAQIQPDRVSQMMQTSLDIREEAVLTENITTDQESQHESSVSDASLQVAPKSNHASTLVTPVVQPMSEAETQHRVESSDSKCQTDLTIGDLEEMLANLKRKLEEKPMIQEIVHRQQRSPVHTPISYPVDKNESAVQTFLETVQRSTSPILQEVKDVITQYESELKDFGIQVKPDAFDQQMETFVANVKDAAIQYAMIYSKDKPTQFSPDIRNTGSNTTQGAYKESCTNTEVMSVSFKMVETYPDRQSTYVQAKSQMHELSTMTPVKHYVHRAVQEQPTMQSQVLQVNPEVRVGSTLTEINPAEESSSQTDPLPEPEPFTAHITLEPVYSAPPSLLPEMLVADTQTEGTKTVHQGTSMQVPKLYSNLTQVTLQMRNTSTMTSPMHTVAKAVQEQPSLNSTLIQAHPDVGDGTTWIETYPHIEHGSQTDPLPEVEPLIAPATIEQVHFPPTLIPETLVAESQTETIHQVDHETSMQSAFFFSSYTQVSPKMTDTYTMTHPRRNAPKAAQIQPDRVSQMMQTSLDIREEAVLTENITTDQESQHESSVSDASLQVAPKSNHASTLVTPVVQPMSEAETQHRVESSDSKCQTDLTIGDLEEMLANLKRKLEEKPMIQEIVHRQQRSPVHTPISYPVDKNESAVQTFLETVQRSTSPILQEVKDVITQYESELKDFGIQVKPDAFDQQMETFVASVKDAAIQYAMIYSKDKPTQFSPDIRNTGSNTTQGAYKESCTNTEVMSVSFKMVETYPDRRDKATVPVLKEFDKRGTQTSAVEHVSRWSQHKISLVDVPIQADVSVLQDVLSQTDTILKDDIEAMLKPIERQDVRLEMRSFRETNSTEIQTDPVIIKCPEPDEESKSWIDSGIDTDVQTDPIVILSDVESEIDLLDEDSQTNQVDMIDADIQVKSSTLKDTTSQTAFDVIARTVQTEPKQVSYVSTITVPPAVKQISAQTVPTQTATKALQFQPVLHFKVGNTTQTPLISSKEQGTHAYEHPLESSATQTDVMPVIQPEIIQVASLQPVESPLTFPTPTVYLTNAKIQASVGVTDRDSQTIKVHIADRPSQTTVLMHNRDTQFESNAKPKKTQTDTRTIVNMGTITDNVISQDICLQTLETKPDNADRSVQHVAMVLSCYSQTGDAGQQHEGTQTDKTKEEIQYILPIPEAHETFTQTKVECTDTDAQTQNPVTVEKGADAVVTKVTSVSLQAKPTTRLITKSKATDMEPKNSVGMSIQTDMIPVHIVDEYVSLVHIQPVHAPLKLPQFKPDVQDTSVQTSVKTNDESMQHDSENMQVNIFSKRVIKGEVTPVVISEFSLAPQKKQFISHLESKSQEQKESLTLRHSVDRAAQVKPEIGDMPVQVHPILNDNTTTTDEAICKSTEAQTEFIIEPMEEIIRVSHVPEYQAPFLDLGPVLLDTGTQVQPTTNEHGISASLPMDESYLDLGPMLLDTGTQARPKTNEHGMLTLVPLEPLPAWTQTEIKMDDSAAQHELEVENATSQTSINQQEQSTFTRINVRPEGSQATVNTQDAVVQTKTEREISVMTAGIQTVVIYEEKPATVNCGVQFKPSNTEQATLTSKPQKFSCSSNTEPVNRRQAMVQVTIKPETQVRATLTTPKYSKDITTQANKAPSYDACVQHDNLPDLADKSLQIKPLMLDDTSETAQLQCLDRPTQVDIHAVKPLTSDVSIQLDQESTEDKISQIKPAVAEAGVSTEVMTKDMANQTNLSLEVDEFIKPDTMDMQHAPFSFPVVTVDHSVQHQPPYDVQSVQINSAVTERASSPAGPDYTDSYSQTKADASRIGLQTHLQETSEVQSVTFHSDEELLYQEALDEEIKFTECAPEEREIVSRPNVSYQDSQVQHTPRTKDSMTATVSMNLDFSVQSQPLAIEQGTTTDIKKQSQVEVQVDMERPKAVTQETAVQHNRQFKQVDAFTQIHPLMVEEGTSAKPLKRTEASVQFVAPKEKEPLSPKVKKKVTEKGTSTEYVTMQSSTQTVLLKSDVGLQSKPDTKSELSLAVLKPASQEQSSGTMPDVCTSETQASPPNKTEGSQCDRATMVHNMSQYEKIFIEDNSVQVKPVIREQANSPIFKRKDVGHTSSQTDALQEEIESAVENLMKSTPYQPFKSTLDTDYMNDYSSRLKEYLEREDEMTDFVDYCPIERVEAVHQQQERSSPIYDYGGNFSSRLYDSEMNEMTDVIERLVTSEVFFDMEEPIKKDETDGVMSEFRFYVESSDQTGDVHTKERSTSPLFPPTREKQSQIDLRVGHSDTNVQVSPTMTSESSYTTPVPSNDVSSQADFGTEKIPVQDVSTQHCTLLQDTSSQAQPSMMDDSMTYKVASLPVSTQMKPETFEQGTSTQKRQKLTSDMQTQALPDAATKTTSPVAVRKNQIAVQTKIDKHDSFSQNDQVQSTEAVVQTILHRLERGTSTKPDNRNKSIQANPTLRHETSQYENTIKTVDFMVQYHVPHLDSSTQSADSKTSCQDRANSPIHIELAEMKKDSFVMQESPVQPVIAQQVSSSPMDFQPLEQNNTEIQQAIRDRIQLEVIQDVQQMVREEFTENIKEEIRMEVREEVRQEILEETREDIRQEVRAELIEMNSQVEAEVRQELKSELQITIREELKEEFIEEYKEEILTEIKEELKIEFESRIRLEIEEYTRDDLEFQIRREIEPRIRHDLEPIIRKEIEQEYVKETIHEVRAEALVMYQPTEYKPEPIKPLMLDRGTSPIVSKSHDAPVQVRSVTHNRSSQSDKPCKSVDSVSQTHVSTVERGTTPYRSFTSNVTVQAKPKLVHHGTTPIPMSHRESAAQVEVQKADKCGQYKYLPSQSDVAVQFSRTPHAVGVPCQVQPDTVEQGTSAETIKSHRVYIQTENPLRKSENTQTCTEHVDAVCQSEPVFYSDTMQQVKPITFNKSTLTQLQEVAELSTQVEPLNIIKPVEKVPIKLQDNSVQHEQNAEVTDRRIQVQPVLREQANSPLTLFQFDVIYPQHQEIIQVPPYSVYPLDVPEEHSFIKELITDEKVSPVEHTPLFVSQQTNEAASFRRPSFPTDRPFLSPTLEPQVARLDYVPLRMTDVETFQTAQSCDNSLEYSSNFTKDVLNAMPPRCEMIVLQTRASGTTYTSAFRTSTPTTSVQLSSGFNLPRTSIKDHDKPPGSFEDKKSLLPLDTESDSFPEINELERIRRDLRLSRVIVTDDQATLVGFWVKHDHDRSTYTPDLPGGSPFSSPDYTHSDKPSRSGHRSLLHFGYTPRSPCIGSQHFMNLEHGPKEVIPDVIMDDPTDDLPMVTEEGNWFRRETSAYRLNVPYDKKGSPHPGARIVYSLSPYQSPIHSPGHMSPVHMSPEHRLSLEKLPIPRGMVTRLSDLLTEELSSDDDSILPISRLSELIEKHRELSRPPKWTPQSGFILSDSEPDAADSDTDTESFNAVMDLSDPFLHEDPNFWPRYQADFCSSSTNSDVSSDDDTITVFGDCDVQSFDLPTSFLQTTKFPRDNTGLPGEPPRKRRSIKIDRSRIREELSMSEVVLPEGPPRLTGYRMNMDISDWQRDWPNTRLSRSEPDLYRATTASIPSTSPPSYATAYPYTSHGFGRRHPDPEHLMVDAGAMPALSAEIRYAKVVEKRDTSHLQWSQHGRLSKSDPDLASRHENLFDVGQF